MTVNPGNSHGEVDPLSEEALKHFKTYKYSSVDKSPLSNYVLKHYWNFCVEFLPLWLAPNMVTLLGFFCILFNVGLCFWTDPALTGPPSPWIAYSYALGVWAYSTLDNIDGKQARRTHTSSGLGELFDHGIDSLNCTLASLLETSAMGLGATRLGAFTALVPCLPMFFSTWETYHTHTLFLGYFNGPTEGLLIASLIMAASGYFGPSLWTSALPFGLAPWTFVDIWAPLLLVAFTIAHLPSCVANVANARRAQNLPLAPCLLEWTPMLVFCGSLTAWLGSPHSHILVPGKENHLVLLCLTLSLVFGRMTTKIILAHLTRQPFPLWTSLLFPLIIGALLAWLPLFGVPALSPKFEVLYLWLCFGVSAVVYFRWAILTINAICGYLGITCLTIPEAQVQALEAERRGEPVLGTPGQSGGDGKGRRE